MADPCTRNPRFNADTRTRSRTTPLSARSGSAPEIGSVIARVFDLLEGSGLEPFAAQIASSIVNGARRPCRG